MWWRTGIGRMTSFCLGGGGEFATNRQEAQEVTMLALHLLQSSLVYINTLMLQRVLSESAWEDRLTAEDRRALTSLFYGHVTLYGTFHLDLNTRLDIEPATLTESLVPLVSRSLGLSLIG